MNVSDENNISIFRAEVYLNGAVSQNTTLYVSDLKLSMTEP
jgi:hypothetical protein